jgi:murein DD-endopeptidase MepM/ murein hydrolase activator NlpD
VAQLGARFHGMEEVVGSIPTRSTKFPNPVRAHVEMSRINWGTHTVWLALALFLLAACLPASAAPWTVSSEPTRLVNGTPVLFRVTTRKKFRSLSGTWLGHTVEFTYDDGSKEWFALAATSFETKPGSYPIELHADASSGQAISFEKKIRIEHQSYPQVSIKVAGKYTAPNPDDQAAILKDKETKADIFKTVSPDRKWRGSFAPPATAEISDVFGIQRVFNGVVQSTHQGLDFRVPTGTPVTSVNRGRVILARPLFFEGNCVVIDHGQGLLSLYLHMSKFSVQEGDEVEKGQEIGFSGGTGRATGPHLHLAVRWQGVYLDPQALLKMKLPE